MSRRLKSLTKKVRLNARPGFEALETRVLYAVTTAVSSGQLVVTGDGSADTIAVSHPAPLTTAVNGQFFNESLFPNGIVVNAGGGDDVINLQSTVLPATLDGQDGTDHVTVGQGSNVQGVLGAVFVQDSGTGAGGATSLTVDDRLDAGSTSVAVTVSAATGIGTVAGMAPGTITYADARVTPLLLGGAGNDVYTINGTDSVGEFGINAGGGKDTFNVRATGGTMFVDGEAGTNQFNITGNNFNTSALGDVFIDSDGGVANVLVDDNQDPVGRTVTFSTDRPANAAPDAVITGMTRANTTLHMDLNETKVLIVHASGAGNTINVADLATPDTLIGTGKGNDTVNLMKSDVPFTVDLVDGTDAVNVGNAGILQDFRGDVFIKQSVAGTYDLVVDDSADRVARNVLLDRINSTGSIGGLAPATIRYHLGMRSVTVRGGSGGNTFSVSETTTPVGNPGSFPGTNTFIDAGTGNDTVNVLRTMERVKVDGVAGHDTFNVGADNNMQAIRGNLFFVGGNAYDLNLNDSADTTPRNVLVTDITVTNILTGLAPAEIRYHAGGFNSMTLNAGSGGNTITFDDPNTIAETPNSPVTINSGLGNDTVNVLRTFQPVNVRGQSGTDFVNVGFNGSTQGIKKNLLITNSGSRSTLTFNDAADPVGRGVTMDVFDGTTLLRGLSPGDIRYFNSDVSSVGITAGPGGNAFTVNDTPNNNVKPLTTLNTGAGADLVVVRGTTGPLTVNGQNGRDSVIVGNNGTVASVKGTLTVTNSGSFSAITINDQNDAAGQFVSFGADNTTGSASITGLAPASINYRTFDLSTLTVNGGSGADVFNVFGTAINSSGPANTAINANAGPDTINVRATSGPLTVNAGAGNDDVNVGTTFNTLDPIKGPVNVNGQGDFDILNVNDQGSLTPHVYGVTPTTVTRSGAATIGYLGIESLRLNKGNTNTGGTPPLAQDLALPLATHRGQAVTLTGRLVDPDLADTLTLAVDWGDGTAPLQLAAGRDPFAVTHRYNRLGRFTVRVMWTDGSGQSNFQELHIDVVSLLAPARRTPFVG